MPLIIFNYLQEHDNPSNDVLNEFRQTIVLPRHSLDKRWRLHAVNAVYHSDDKENFQTFEFRIPELMNNEKILYATKGLDVEAPKDTFRFYAKQHQTQSFGGIREYSVHSICCEYPDLDLGFHDKSSGELNLYTSAKVGNGDRLHCTLNSYSIILEYEE